jgi:hypothetical protein
MWNWSEEDRYRLRGQLPHASDRGGPVVMLRLLIKLIIRSARSESGTAAVSRLSCYCQVLIQDYSSKYECLRLEPRGRLICNANAAATNTREWPCERSLSVHSSGCVVDRLLDMESLCTLHRKITNGVHVKDSCGVLKNWIQL